MQCLWLYIESSFFVPIRESDLFTRRDHQETSAPSAYQGLPPPPCLTLGGLSHQFEPSIARKAYEQLTDYSLRPSAEELLRKKTDYERRPSRSKLRKRRGEWIENPNIHKKAALNENRLQLQNVETAYQQPIEQAEVVEDDSPTYDIDDLIEEILDSLNTELIAREFSEAFLRAIQTANEAGRREIVLWTIHHLRLTPDAVEDEEFSDYFLSASLRRSILSFPESNYDFQLSVIALLQRIIPDVDQKWFLLLEMIMDFNIQHP